MFNYKKILSVSLIMTLALVSGYSFVEPMVSNAQASASDSVNVTLVVNSEITISAETDVTMSPNLGLSVNTSNGEVAWTVKTNDANGYALTVQGNQDPLLQSASSTIADYTEGTTGVPEQWSVSNAVEFGFSAYGSHVSTSEWGADASCTSVATPGTGRLYRGFDGTTPIQIASHNATTTLAGTVSTVCFGAEQDTVLAAAGTYTGTVTATATVQ